MYAKNMSLSPDKSAGSKGLLLVSTVQPFQKTAGAGEEVALSALSKRRLLGSQLSSR